MHDTKRASLGSPLALSSVSTLVLALALAFAPGRAAHAASSKKAAAASAGASEEAVSGGKAEDFKGEPPAQELTLGGLAGLGIINGRGSLAILGHVAKKIVHKGFVPDINNQVFIEAQAGPVIFSGPDAVMFSFHLRWDFPKDDQWTVYALAGVGGSIVGMPAPVSDDFQLYPRFGAGAIYKLAGNNLSLRGEVSHELIGVGIQAAF